MASKWLMKSFSSMIEVPQSASRKLMGHHGERKEHGGQFITEFFSAVEDTYDTTNDRNISDPYQDQTACENCAGSSHCLNFLDRKEERISWGLRPLLILGTLTGLSPRKRKPCNKSCLFSLILVLILWANFGRFFLNYSGPRNYGTELFMKLTLHVWYGQIAVTQTLFFFHISPQLKRFFSTWNRYCVQYHCTTAHHIRSHALRHICTMFLIIASLTACSICVIVFEDPYRSSASTKFLLNLPKVTKLDLKDLRIMQGLFTAFTVYCATIWIWPIAFVASMISGLKYNYADIAAKIAKNYRTIDTYKLEQTRRRHQSLCAIVRQADGLFSFYCFLVYTTAIPLICFTLYNFAFRTYDDSKPMEMVMLMVHVVVLAAQLVVLTSTAASLTNKAVAPKEDLLDVQYDANDSLCHLKAVQVMLFLHRLSHSHIGFTAWKLINITRTTIMTVTTMILSYVLVLVKFGLTLEPLSKQNCTTGH